MMISPAEIQALRDTQALEASIVAVETQLSALGNALKGLDAGAAEAAAAELHRTLADAIDRFGLAARHGGLPPALRRRLALTSGQVAAQRDAVARASTSLDRAIDVLLPASSAAAGYGVAGNASRSSGGGLAQA